MSQDDCKIVNIMTIIVILRLKCIDVMYRPVYTYCIGVHVNIH